MGENRSVLTALGAILGLILFVYVILQGVNYFRQGAAEFDELQRQAGAPILLSETLREPGEAAVAAGEELTETVATTETTAITSTEAMTATEAAATTEPTDTTAVTDTITVTEAVASAETLTDTAAITDTVDAEEGEVAATAATTTTEAITATAAVTEDGGTDEGAVAESTAITATETTTDTAEADAPPAAEAQAAEPAEEAPATEAVAMAVPAPEDVAPIFTKAGCIACHVIPDIPGAAGAIGPNLSEIGVIGATRIDGYTAEEYLYESILEPNAFIAPECPTGPCLPGLMVQNLGDVLTPEEIDMVVAYLASMGVAE